ncbi:hypothetical protein [uncultured Boseongicola sp.]|jgi:hypothetical protein|uniref:hypothetical protein n=1 Tax=uncultured Boseongicola sp. TaxID=1648499 RepID=UPI0026213914|nr:hypothetical protein [uncultured Boseongicola sp.]
MRIIGCKSWLNEREECTTRYEQQSESERFHAGYSVVLRDARSPAMQLCRYNRVTTFALNRIVGVNSSLQIAKVDPAKATMSCDLHPNWLW